MCMRAIWPAGARHCVPPFPHQTAAADAAAHTRTPEPSQVEPIRAVPHPHPSKSRVSRSSAHNHVHKQTDATIACQRTASATPSFSLAAPPPCLSLARACNGGRLVSTAQPRAVAGGRPPDAPVESALALRSWIFLNMGAFFKVRAGGQGNAEMGWRAFRSAAGGLGRRKPRARPRLPALGRIYLRKNEKPDLAPAQEHVLHPERAPILGPHRDAAQVAVHVVLRGRQIPAIDLARLELHGHVVALPLVQQLDGNGGGSHFLD